jgi:hypothetical protein
MPGKPGPFQFLFLGTILNITYVPLSIIPEGAIFLLINQTRNSIIPGWCLEIYVSLG